MSRPIDMTFEEMVTLFGYYGLSLSRTGKTGGSRVRFENEAKTIAITFHKPHNPNTFKRYVIDNVIDALKREGFLK